MSTNSSDEENISLKNIKEEESPRKRAKTDPSPRKSWSLMDKRTDIEVLQEMGVGLLEADDSDPASTFTPTSSARHSKQPQKRKHGSENKNPNVDMGLSPRSKLSPSPRKKMSPRSPKCKGSPVPGTSKGTGRSPNKSNEVKQAKEWLVADEETPVGQCVPRAPLAEHVAQPSPPTTEGANTPVKYYTSLLPQASPFNGPDSFAALSDEMMLSIFKWLPKRCLAHCMTVCKRWHRVANDETLWQRLDLGNKKLNKGAIGMILAKKPLIVRLAGSEIGEWHPNTDPVPSRIQFLDLTMCYIDTRTLDCLLERCPALKKLSLESVTLSPHTAEIIGRCSNLETLNLVMAQGLTEDGVGALLTGCPNLQALNLAWCGLSAEALEVVVSCLPQRLQRLALSGARSLTDDMVAELVLRCPRLLELDISDCSRVTAVSVLTVRSLTRLEHLALSRCYLLPPSCLRLLGFMPSLQYLEVWGMLQTGSLNALKSELPGIQINQFKFSAIARPTVGSRRTSIWGLRTRD